LLFISHYSIADVFPAKREALQSSTAREQGDQIGRSFAIFEWLFTLGRIFKTTTETANIHISYDKKWAGRHFGRFFSQTHPVTVLENKVCFWLMVEKPADMLNEWNETTSRRWKKIDATIILKK
jgi:hypothetical protein